MPTTVSFQDQNFPVFAREDGLFEVRYTHVFKSPSKQPVAGVVASRDTARLPILLKVQSAAMGGTQMEPR